MGLKKLQKYIRGTHLSRVDLRSAECVVVGTHIGGVECIRLSSLAEDHCLAITLSIHGGVDEMMTKNFPWVPYLGLFVGFATKAQRGP